MDKSKKTVFSGIQPSGHITLGNYLGAIKNWVKMQEDFNSIFCVVDMHAITVRHIPSELRRKTLEVLALYIACGLDPDKNTLFIQSQVPAHAQLAWVLNCYSMFGELGRMTQFKEKSASNAENVNAGLFTYPTLMAADILLYQSSYVPVGDDQKQHVELTRDIALRFNGQYGEVFTLPEPYIPKVGARIMSLTEPDKKMSKSSEQPNSSVLLLDSPDVIMRKFKRAVTDSGSSIRFSGEKTGIDNLLTIYSAATGKTIAEAEALFESKGYGVFKAAVGEAVVELLSPIREKAEDLLANKDYLEQLYKKGAQKAAAAAGPTIKKVYKKLGFIS